MDNFLFVLKTFAASLLILLVMQIKWGEQTIDDTIYGQIRSSTILAPVQSVADGGVLWIKNMYRGTTDLFSEKLQGQIADEAAPGNRQIVELKRHADKAKEKSKEARSRFTEWMNSDNEPSETVINE
jgi:hypothetical protein